MPPKKKPTKAEEDEEEEMQEEEGEEDQEEDEENGEGENQEEDEEKIKDRPAAPVIIGHYPMQYSRMFSSTGYLQIDLSQSEDEKGNTWWSKVKQQFPEETKTIEFRHGDTIDTDVR